MCLVGLFGPLGGHHRLSTKQPRVWVWCRRANYESHRSDRGIYLDCPNNNPRHSGRRDLALRRLVPPQGAVGSHVSQRVPVHEPPTEPPHRGTFFPSRCGGCGSTVPFSQRRGNFQSRSACKCVMDNCTSILGTPLVGDKIVQRD